jgi:hypothetical protein
MALTPEQVANYDVQAQAFGMKKLDDLTQMGATRQQIIDIARRTPVVGTRLQEIFPELGIADCNRKPSSFAWYCGR